MATAIEGTVSTLMADREKGEGPLSPFLLPSVYEKISLSFRRQIFDWR